MNLAIFGDDLMYNEEHIKKNFVTVLYWATYKNLEKCYVLTKNRFDKMICSELKRLKHTIPEVKIVYATFNKDEEYDKELFDEVEYIDFKIEDEKLAEIVRNEYIVYNSDFIVVYDAQESVVTPSLRAAGTAWMLNKEMLRIERYSVTPVNSK